jgi:hypothetical protein
VVHSQRLYLSSTSKSPDVAAPGTGRKTS